jgi:hypothetical protein
MRVRAVIWVGVGFLSVVGCGSSSTSPGSAGAATSAPEFSPPPVPEGYTRIVAPVIEGIEPGGDAIKCQYVLTPFDRDMDVLDIQGYQSKGGHHSIAYAVKGGAPVGTSRDCNAVDNTSIGGFLGGIGGEAGGKAQLPEGVVFRLPKGSTVMLNTHFLNTTEETIDGHTVLDVKFSEVDPTRRVASIFVNFTQNFTVQPARETTVDASCTVRHDLSFLSFTNHMHSHGASAVTSLQSSGNTVTVHEDPTWTSDMQFNPVFTNYSLDAPLTVKAGDVLTTHCDWKNSTASAFRFPDEMCVGFGFFLSDGSSSPTCVEGVWTELSSAP